MKHFFEFAIFYLLPPSSIAINLVYYTYKCCRHSLKTYSPYYGLILCKALFAVDYYYVYSKSFLQLTMRNKLFFLVLFNLLFRIFHHISPSNSMLNFLYVVERKRKDFKSFWTNNFKAKYTSLDYSLEKPIYLGLLVLKRK